MAVTAEQLNIILSAKDKQFNDALKRSQKQVEFFSKKSQKQLNKTTQSFDMMGAAVGKFGAALSAGAIVGGFARLLDDATKTAKEIDNLARISGTGVERFQELAFAAKTVGLEQDKLSDILKDVNDKFGDYLATGAGPLADFFDNIAPKIGITKEAFAGLSSDQALGLYIKSLQQAGVNQQELTFYLEALASDATALSPLFYNNAQALDTLSASARELGIVLDEDLIQKSVALRNRWEQVMASMTSKFTTFALTVAKGFDAVFNLSEMEQMKELEEEMSKIEEKRARLSDRIRQRTLEPRGDPKKNQKAIDDYVEKLNSESRKLNELNEQYKAIVDNLELRINLEDELLSIQDSQPSGATALDKTITKTKTLAAEVSKLETVMGSVESSMEQAFMSMFNGTMSAKDAFRTMAADIISELYRIFLVKQVTGFITGAITGALAPNSAAGTGGAIAPPIAPRASGGTVRAGSPVMTGESGRELFVPSQNGRILSPAQSRGALSGGGNDVTVVQNINVTTGVQQTVRAEVLGLMPQIAEASKAAVLDAKRRGGAFAGAF